MMILTGMADTLAATSSYQYIVCDDSFRLLTHQERRELQVPISS